MIPSLSVVMIVKDEENTLARCLKSVESVGDELVIVDTGSTDGTVEIARHFTRKLYFHSWEDDFSKARNQALSYCTCSWCLQIDADEELVSDDIPLLRETLKQLHPISKVHAVLMPILSYLPSGLMAKHYFQRLYRRKRVHYEGSVHNQVEHDGQMVTAEIRLLHYGYALPREEMHRKQEVRRRLMEKEIEKTDPESARNSFAWMNLIRLYRNWLDWEKVIELAPRVLEHPGAQDLHRQTVAADALMAYAGLHRYELGINVGLKALEETPDSMDVLHHLGWLYLSAGQPDQAKEIFQRWLAYKMREHIKGPRATYLIIDTHSCEPQIWEGLARCYHMTGKRVSASNAMQQAVLARRRAESANDFR